MIPRRTQETLEAWIANARPTGSFCAAVIQNDLRLACARADESNHAALFEIVAWMEEHAPAESWGYRGALEEWPQIIARRRSEDRT